MKLKSALVLLTFGLASSAFAAPVTYFASLSGPGESPPNTSPGTGFADVTIDTATNTLTVFAVFSGLGTGTTASHIHCCIAPPGATGVATTTPTFPGFPLGVTSGTYSATFDLSLASSWNPAFITANGGTPLSAESTLAAGLAAGMAYWNIHTMEFPNGEVRGFLVATPEPASFGLTALAIAGLLAGRRVVKKRKP